MTTDKSLQKNWKKFAGKYKIKPQKETKPGKLAFASMLYIFSIEIQIFSTIKKHFWTLFANNIPQHPQQKDALQQVSKPWESN